MKRRSFLPAVGAGTPTLQLVGTAAGAAGEPEKFTPINLGPHFNASARDFGPRQAARSLNAPSVHDDLIHTLSGEQQMQGIPFLLGPTGINKRSWVVLSPAFVLRLAGLAATPESVARVHKRVAEINQQLQQSGAPFRLRVM
jgi:hypothetical protein